MLKLLRYLKGYRAESIIAPLAKMLEAVGELIIPLLVASIIDVGIPAGNTKYIVLTGVIMLAISVVGLLFSMLCQYLAARASIGFGTNVRKNLMHKINALPLKQINAFSTGSLITRLNVDVTQTQVALAMFIRLVLRAPIITVGAIIMAMTISPPLALWFLILSVCVAVIMAIIMKITGKKYLSVQRSVDEVTTAASEQLAGARVIRAFSKQEDMQNGFAARVNVLKKNSFTASVTGALLNPITFALVNFTIIALLYFGAIKINAGTFSAGELIALINYLSQVLLSLVVMANLLIIFTRASASAKRINEVFAAKEEPFEAVKAVESVRSENAKESEFVAVFDNVSFSYDGNVDSTLKKLSFDIRKGERVGIIGSTASGKSTLISLIPLLEVPTDGSLSIFGEDANSVNPELVRKRVSLAPQGSPVFSGTVKSNLLIAKPDADGDEMIDALKKAQAWDFVLQKGGLDMEIAEGGKNLSGGQKQRINIARALLKTCEILILDDVTSALDFSTEAKVRKALEKFPGTVITISQRISSIAPSDKIIVMDDGEVAGIGTHKQLLKSCEKYLEIYSSQI